MTWGILRGRKVVHRIYEFGGRVSTACGQSRGRYLSDVREESNCTRRCEQCEITLVTGVRGAFYKFFVDHVPLEIRQRRRQLWRAHLGLPPIKSKPSTRKALRLQRRTLIKNLVSIKP